MSHDLGPVPHPRHVSPGTSGKGAAWHERSGSANLAGVPVLAAVLAHQGGWDEMLMVAVPIALFAGLLHLANKRAQAGLDADGDDAAADEPRDITPG